MSGTRLFYPSPEGGGWSAKPTGWGPPRLNPTRPRAEPVIGPRIARTRWLASALPLQETDRKKK